MPFAFLRSPQSWTEEDLETAASHLAESFPRLVPHLRRAIVSLASQELPASKGRDRLLALVTHFARECPHTIGMEAALSS